MTAARTAEAIAAKAAAPHHQHDLADIADAGALAALDVVGTAEIDAAAYASQSDAVAGTDDTKIMTALRTAEAIAAQPAGEHQHDLADITRCRRARSAGQRRHRRDQGRGLCVARATLSPAPTKPRS